MAGSLFARAAPAAASAGCSICKKGLLRSWLFGAIYGQRLAPTPQDHFRKASMHTDEFNEISNDRDIQYTFISVCGY